jgi:hypothetical protein
MNSIKEQAVVYLINKYKLIGLEFIEEVEYRDEDGYFTKLEYCETLEGELDIEALEKGIQAYIREGLEAE